MNSEINGITQISVQEAADLIPNQNAFLLDVRELHEHEFSTIEGARAQPLSTLPDTYQDIPRDKDILCLCRSGGRSQQAAEFLKANGFTHVVNITGGINAWAEQIDTRLSTY